jgi:hypothetical protein
MRYLFFICILFGACHSKKNQFEAAVHFQGFEVGMKGEMDKTSLAFDSIQLVTGKYLYHFSGEILIDSPGKKTAFQKESFRLVFSDNPMAKSGRPLHFTVPYSARGQGENWSIRWQGNSEKGKIEITWFTAEKRIYCEIAPQLIAKTH